MSAQVDDKKYMSLALSLAEKGRGKTSPNPMVGTVIVKNNKVIGCGYHRGYGKEHAETSAIKNAKGSTKGASLYVNLEPCCHTGNTGPCTSSIIKAGFKKVIIGSKDPNQIVNGKGIRILRKADIEVKIGVKKDENYKLNDAYFNYHQNRRLFVILKMAQSLDGRIAVKSGDSKYISSKETLKFVHKIRSEVDAIVVGAETLKKDNPSLTVRHVKGRDPYRIIVSDSIKLNPDYNIIKNNSDYKTIIATSENGYKRLSKSKFGKDLIYWILKNNKSGKIDLDDFIKKADSFGLRSILIEGGARLATSFLKAKLVDKFIMATSPILIGEGINSINNLRVTDLSKALSFKLPETFNCGRDSVFVGYPDYK